jgi:signal transduction histidine kinase
VLVGALMGAIRTSANGLRASDTDPRILEALDAGVLATTADGVIVRVNRCGAGILGRSREALLGRNVSEVLAPIAELLAAGEPSSGEHRKELPLAPPEHAPMRIGFSVSTFGDEQGPDPLRHVVLFRDISPILELRKQRDDLLQMAALGVILPAVLHELRNPLSAVTSMLEVMVEETEGPMQSDLHALLWELRRMHLNLQGVGGFSRPVFAAGNVAVDYAIREACRVLEATAQRKDVTLECNVDDMPVLPLDRGVLNGVVFNLVTNSIDACKSGGRVTVRARLPDPSTFELVVADDGRGMTPEILAKCCDLFFTSKDGGSGIGLTLCREAVTNGAGTLDIQSAPATGTKVTLRIPLAGKKH